MHKSKTSTTHLDPLKNLALPTKPSPLKLQTSQIYVIDQCSDMDVSNAQQSNLQVLFDIDVQVIDGMWMISLNGVVRWSCDPIFCSYVVMRGDNVSIF